ncbi:DUF4231 domain-containing protein [Mycoplasma phocoenae]|uniref:DUF4231 domain-containing protein n=1 Tax=Mycoplasma phocoenae TaxID=754517 RepID=A0A858U5B1_9MOLU|nr:DUF4231 domain-containing protein [Mycoplasma phocoenae]QJG67249.1 DUF4231 domain-containing protein [Mycoplasma phocoenae]
MTNKTLNNDLLNNVESEFKKYRRKFWKSHLIYLIIALVIMVVSSLQVLLNLFAIRFNEYLPLRQIFMVIAIISSVIVFLQSVLLFFDFKRAKEENSVKLNNLLKLKKTYLENPEFVKTAKLANQIYDINKEK